MNAYEERQAFCNLQVKLCDPCLRALRLCILQMALYNYYYLLFQLHQATMHTGLTAHVSVRAPIPLSAADTLKCHIKFFSITKSAAAMQPFVKTL